MRTLTQPLFHIASDDQIDVPDDDWYYCHCCCCCRTALPSIDSRVLVCAASVQCKKTCKWLHSHWNYICISLSLLTWSGDDDDDDDDHRLENTLAFRRGCDPKYVEVDSCGSGGVGELVVLSGNGGDGRTGNSGRLRLMSRICLAVLLGNGRVRSVHAFRSRACSWTAYALLLLLSTKDVDPSCRDRCLPFPDWLTTESPFRKK